MEISSDKSKILVNSLKPRPSTSWKWKCALKNGPVQILGIHTNKGWEIINGSNDQTGTGTLSRKEYGKTKPPVFLQRLNTTNHSSCQYCSRDVRAGRWLRILRDESKPLKVNATGWCLAYHTETVKRKRTNTYCNSSMYSPEIRNFYYQPSSVASYLPYFSHVCIHYTLSKIISHGTVDGIVVVDEDRKNHGGTAQGNGQAGNCRRCCAS